MKSKTNLSSTRRTVAAFRRSERLADVDAALICLAETTAAALDEAQSSDAPAYAVAKAAAAHRGALADLYARADAMAPGEDAMDAFFAALSVPTPGTSEDTRPSWFATDDTP